MTKEPKKHGGIVVKALASIVFALCAILRIVVVTIVIDATTIILLVLAFAPWFIEHIKAVEITGVGKVELDKDRKRIEENSKDLPEIDLEDKDFRKYTFYNLRHEDLTLALAGMRIKIEEIMRDILINADIGYENKHGGIKASTQLLYNNGIIDGKQQHLSFEMLKVLNKAIHTQLTPKDYDACEWIFESGMKFLVHLDNIDKGFKEGTKR